MIKATVVIDNRREEEQYRIEHGFSLYVETSKHKCLVDVGLSKAFLDNAEQLGIDIADIDYLFLSHGHVDHVGGLPFFLKQNDKAEIIVSSLAFEQKYFSTRRGLKDISANINIDADKHRFVFVEQDMSLEKDIHVIIPTEKKYPLPLGNQTLWKDAGNGRVKDDFAHELIFCFGKEKLMVCSGCAHNGVANILSTVSSQINVPIATVIGGFHLLDVDDMSQYESAQEISDVANLLKEKYPEAIFYTGHCTGDEPFENMKKVLGGNLHQFYVGKQVECNFN